MQDPDGEDIMVRGTGRLVQFVPETAEDGVLKIQMERGPDEDEEYENIGMSLVLVPSWSWNKIKVPIVIGLVGWSGPSPFKD